MLHFLYNTFLGRLFKKILPIRFLSWLYGFIQNVSWSCWKIDRFVKKYNIDMSDYIVPQEGFASFNDFFIRKLKPDARQIDSDSSVIISPADSQLLVVPVLRREIRFFVKSKLFCLKNFLRNDLLSKSYEGGSLLLFRLAPYDYHRYHFPFDCVPSNPTVISGTLESVNPIAYKAGYMPLQENERHLTTLKTDLFGDVVFVSVGAMFVGQITHTYSAGQAYKKGAEMGFFALGGSSIVMLFKRGMVTIEEKFLENSSRNVETVVKMGERIAKCKFIHR